MKKVLSMLLFTYSLTIAQVSLDGVNTYSEDFNTLTSTGTSSTVPTGWAFSESGTNANGIYTAGTGSGNAGDTYSFGATSATDRAFGGLQSGTLIPTIGASFINNTGFTITQLPISYTGEQWRLGATGRNDRLDFQYSLDATSLSTGTWTDVDGLDFIAPNSTGTVGSLDGNASANRTTITQTITGLSIANGATFWIRWIDFNATGADDGLAIDDFSIDETNLPVELSSFTAIVLENSVKLNWRTETEVNNYGFEILRGVYPAKSRTQNDKWEKIGFVEGNGNSNSPKDYTFTDNLTLTRTLYYRLKQIDTDGQSEYSKVIEVDAGIIPAEIVLEQNYPNPFNPSTTIRFNFTHSGDVRLSIYNLLGEQIMQLVNGFLEAGIHTVNFNASDLNSGVYLYKFETNGIIQSRKMILAK
ncbi:MAG: T9SS type A sorting domain-containing protein [Ignavibacteriota bacterium]|jgi:hypothetical protein|nr:MAG: T9SS C-terminal target domain-containing protein [Chlorobiota bacterium]MBE7475129.1 T9SS type A sorting domain-containing protein [Ignavibacteriales bacterium]MBL1122530.1 T9SS C-terminal target domain-containing protein [Ignavibacteriota bacterium]MCE7855921.1 T9SS C-terminal target domain-containing protein [Ignavibacteria bacterium CHB3]MCZ7616116.1 T9SS type A sorting domain-containing protein [Ignavibacteriaceae bacterium]MEB2296124.1 T9SS type A sorting domain-containing protein